MADFPLHECVATVDELRAKDPTIRVFQKFTCSHCQTRLTMAEPNTFFSQGTCDKCGATTEIRECNYMLLRALGPGAEEKLDAVIAKQRGN